MKKVKDQTYPIKKIKRFLLWSVTSVAPPTNNFQGNNPKTINICFVSQITPHCIFRCHISTAITQNYAQLFHQAYFNVLPLF